MLNECKVLNVFLFEYCVLVVKDLDFNFNSFSMDRVLGIYWDVEVDIFNLVVSSKF